MADFADMNVKELHQELQNADQQMAALAQLKHLVRQEINGHISRINAAGGHLNREFEEVYPPEGAANVQAPPAAGITQFQATATGTVGTPKEG